MLIIRKILWISKSFATNASWCIHWKTAGFIGDIIKPIEAKYKWSHFKQSTEDEIDGQSTLEIWLVSAVIYVIASGIFERF